MNMANFELWERETLNEFAREATRKLLENEAEITRLRTALRLAADEPNIDRARKIADGVLMFNAGLNGLAPGEDNK